MSERKVLNKYIAPDFDWRALPKGKKPKNEQITIRFMLPFTIRCSTCGEYLPRGRKFNAKKEDALGEKYFNIQAYRFYMRCSVCASDFTLKTDPKNADYVAELNCTRNFELWREKKSIEEEAEAKLQEEENDAIRTLEHRTMDSRREIEALDQLDELRTISAEHASVDNETLLQRHRVTQEDRKRKQEEEDDAAAMAAFSGAGSVPNSAYRSQYEFPIDAGDEEDDYDYQNELPRKHRTLVSSGFDFVPEVVKQQQQQEEDGDSTIPAAPVVEIVSSKKKKEKKRERKEKRSEKTSQVEKEEKKMDEPTVVSSSPPSAEAAKLAVPVSISLGLAGYGSDSD